MGQIKVTYGRMTPLDIEKGIKGQIQIFGKEYQAMTSLSCFLILNPRAMKREI